MIRMRIPGFEHHESASRSAHPAPEMPGDRLVPQLESYCARECRAECHFSHDYDSPEWSECYDSCMETCR